MIDGPSWPRDYGRPSRPRARSCRPEDESRRLPRSGADGAARHGVGRDLPADPGGRSSRSRQPRRGRPDPDRLVHTIMRVTAPGVTEDLQGRPQLPRTPGRSRPQRIARLPEPDLRNVCQWIPTSATGSRRLPSGFLRTDTRRSCGANVDVAHEYFADHYHDHVYASSATSDAQAEGATADAGQATPDMRIDMWISPPTKAVVFVHWQASGRHENQHQANKHVRDIQPDNAGLVEQRHRCSTLLLCWGLGGGQLCIPCRRRPCASTSRTYLLDFQVNDRPAAVVRAHRSGIGRPNAR